MAIFGIYVRFLACMSCSVHHLGLGELIEWLLALGLQALRSEREDQNLSKPLPKIVRISVLTANNLKKSSWNSFPRGLFFLCSISIKGGFPSFLGGIGRYQPSVGLGIRLKNAGDTEETPTFAQSFGKLRLPLCSRWEGCWRFATWSVLSTWWSEFYINGQLDEWVGTELVHLELHDTKVIPAM